MHLAKTVGKIYVFIHTVVDCKRHLHAIIEFYFYKLNAYWDQNQ